MKTIVIALFLMVSCGFAMAQNVKPAKQDKVIPAKTDTLVKYTCSMHPEVKSDKPGKCPKCGMELIKKPNTQISPKVSFQCPMKCEGEKVYDKAGTCPKCGMDLTELKASKALKKNQKSK